MKLVQIVVLGAIFVLVGGILAVNGRRIGLGDADRDEATSADLSGALEFSSVGVGHLKPGERRTAELRVRNVTAKRLRLARPRSCCGCEVIDAAAVTLHPGETASYQVQVRAPAVLGPFERRISLLTHQAAEAVWTVLVSGEVVADWWATPMQVVIEGSGPSQAGNQVRVCYHPGCRIGRVESTDVRVCATRAEPNENSETLELAVNVEPDAQSFMSELSIYDVGGALVLTIPVEWRRRAAFRCFPDIVQIPPTADTPTVEQSIFLFFGESPNSQKIDIEPLVPWVQVLQRVATDRSMRLRVLVDLRRCPHDFNDPLIRITDRSADHQSEHTINARRR